MCRSILKEEPKLDQRTEQEKKDHENRISGSNAISEWHLWAAPKRRFITTLRKGIEKLQNPAKKRTLADWQTEIDKMNKKLSTQVREEIQAISDEYDLKPETTFYTTLEQAKQEIDIPAVILVAYYETNQESVKMTEELSCNRIRDFRRGYSNFLNITMKRNKNTNPFKDRKPDTRRRKRSERKRNRSRETSGTRDESTSTLSECPLTDTWRNTAEQETWNHKHMWNSTRASEFKRTKERIKPVFIFYKNKKINNFKRKRTGGILVKETNTERNENSEERASVTTNSGTGLTS